MAFDEMKHTLSCSANRICKEIHCINHKSEWSVFDATVLGKLMFSLEKAAKVMKMLETVHFEVPVTTSEEVVVKKESHNEHIDDKVVSVLEEMAARAESDYERKRIEDKIKALRNVH